MNELPPKDLLTELARLREENARLKSLLNARGIPWKEDQNIVAGEEAIQRLSHKETRPLDSAAKISLFRRLFRGRSDVYPVRW